MTKVLMDNLYIQNIYYNSIPKHRVLCDDICNGLT